MNRTLVVLPVKEMLFEIGKPQLFAAGAVREVRDCPAVNQLDTPCPTTAFDWLGMEVLAASCSSGRCDVRRVVLDDVASEATAAFFAKDGAPPPERSVLFEVTPQTPDAELEVRGRFDGTDVSGTVRLSSAVAARLDIDDWRAPYRELTKDEDALSFIVGAKLRLGCPRIIPRYDGANPYAPENVTFTSEPGAFQVETVGEAITTAISPDSCTSWLVIQTQTPGRSEVVVRRGELAARLAIRVVQALDVLTFSLHNGGSPLVPLPLTELIPKFRYVSVACVLGLADGSKAFGGCDTLEANAESGLVRSPGIDPTVALVASFQRNAAAVAGGAIRGRVGAAEVVLPVR